MSFLRTEADKECHLFLYRANIVKDGILPLPFRFIDLELESVEHRIMSIRAKGNVAGVFLST